MNHRSTKATKAVLTAWPLIMAALLAGISACATSPQNAGKTGLPFKGWHTWGGLRAEAAGNSVTLTGAAPVTGYVNWRLKKALAGRTITLEVQNAEASRFDGGDGDPEWNRMVKLTVNQNDLLIRPANVERLLSDEYVPASYSRIEFTLPEDFDGKLGLVFYQAELNSLKITAYYK